MITQRQVLESFKSTICPVCGRKKKPRQTLCLMHYRKLPHQLRGALWDRFGDGYEEAVADALKYFECETPHLPEVA